MQREEESGGGWRGWVARLESRLILQRSRGLLTVLSILSITSHWKLKLVLSGSGWGWLPGAGPPGLPATVEFLRCLFYIPVSGFRKKKKSNYNSLGQEPQWRENKRGSDPASETSWGHSTTFGKNVKTSNTMFNYVTFKNVRKLPLMSKVLNV